jgi:hypothetical protein
MKNLTHALFILLLAVQCASGQSSEKILVSTINMNQQNTLIFDLEGPVEVRKWSDSFVQVQAAIFIENSNDAVLKSLVQAGRYQLKNRITADGLVVEAPSLGKQVSVGGVTLKERMSYLVYVPENITVKLVEPRLAEVHQQPK